MRLMMFLLLMMLVPGSFAQTPTEAVTPFMNAYNLREMVQDSQGVLWMSSNGGALRYDPAQDTWTTYPRLQLTGPRGNDCITTSIGSDGLLWFGSATRGVSSFDPVTSRWSFFEEVPSLETRVVRALGDQLFIGTPSGLSLRFQQNRTEICNSVNVSCLVPSFVINDYAKQGDSLWVATLEGLGLHDGSAWVPLDSLPAELAGKNITSLASYNGDLWMVADGLVFRLEDGQVIDTLVGGKKLKVSQGNLYMMRSESVASWSGSKWTEFGGITLPGDGIRDLEVVDEVLYLTTQDGLVRWTGDQNPPVMYPPGPQSADFYFSISAGADGTVWVVNRDGLLRYQESDWDFIAKGTAGLDNEWGASVLALNGEVAVGHCCCDAPPKCSTDFGDGDTFTPSQVYDVWALANDGKWTWAGTPLSGAFVMEEVDGNWEVARQLTTATSGIQGNTVASVAADANEAWFGHQSEGLSYWRHSGSLEGGFWSSITTSRGLLDNSVNVLVKDGNDLWVGTSTGIHRVQGEVVLESRRTTFIDIIGDRPRSVRAIVIDDLDNVWLGTDDGILIWEPGQFNFKHLTLETSSIPSDNIFTGTLNPADGSVWFAGEQGIVRLDPRKVLGIKAGTVPYALYPNPYNPRPISGGSESAQDVIFADLSSGTPLDPEFPEGTFIEVLDITGVVVAEFSYDGTWRWNGLTNGQPVAPGLYVIRARPPGQKAILLKLGVVR